MECCEREGKEYKRKEKKIEERNKGFGIGREKEIKWERKSK